MQLARLAEDRPALVGALRIHGKVRAHRGDVDGADRTFGEAEKLAVETRYLYALGRIQYEWGLVVSERGRSTDARDRLKTALSIFLELGAHPYVERSNRALDGLKSG